jgi:hypothetical protein
MSPTMLIIVNWKAHAPDDPVEWEDAIIDGGFYFARAKHLGLPRPKAILFDKDAEGHLAAMGRYHAKFRAAEEGAAP